MNIVTINVNGIEYKLKGEESTEYLNDISNEVDVKLRDMIGENKNLTLQSAAVLLSINYCDQIRKLKEQQYILDSSIDECNLKIRNLTDENSDLKDRVIHIENENLQFKSKISNLEEEIQAYNDLLKSEKEDLFSDNNEMRELEKEIEILKNTIRKLNDDNFRLKKQLRHKKDF